MMENEQSSVPQRAEAELQQAVERMLHAEQQKNPDSNLCRFLEYGVTSDQMTSRVYSTQQFVRDELYARYLEKFTRLEERLQRWSDLPDSAYRITEDACGIFWFEIPFEPGALAVMDTAQDWDQMLWFIQLAMSLKDDYNRGSIDYSVIADHAAQVTELMHQDAPIAEVWKAIGWVEEDRRWPLPAYTAQQLQSKYNPAHYRQARQPRSAD